ncbi:autotransporter domain-containing protein [Sphingorhabdus soli]|uniref:Autotransporter domain-containing protein n=2 Tax=Flavisphingopyxis soli TaxID=2601267 RepID=A0A5C6UAR4_9SPHN|nr:autotransporter domain-containing protein [Sphingorhabdus soli]
MIVDQQNGYIGLCTATLINPRTVIFAAHCVNDDAATDYGAANGGKPIGFGFAGNALPGILDWYFGTHQTNTANAFYNSNYVTYNPGSLEPEASSFLYSDIAMAALDTPAAGIPTWALMFSQLPDPGAIDADGTGYHVVIEGYGNTGTGTTGSGGSDFRRRIAENTLGALASLDDFETFLFGSPNGLYQNLYWIDFDDPRRGTATASPYDFNAWRDNALPNEGITASGDSGGPLILDDTYDTPLVIGVLSGGYTRFFGGQPANGYGTASFYQPLYLYWDWIVANNPYHYVSAQAGDGNWEDATHWISSLDPNYMVLNAAGDLVNGIPTSPGEGTNPGAGFGQACYQVTIGYNDCYDIATGNETVSGDPIGTINNGKGYASVDGLTAFNPALEASTGSGLITTGVIEQLALPNATLGNGLPGATGFVPNNSDGDPVNGVAPRYFDVTLSANGTTKLSSDVTIDRLTIAGIGAALDITSAGSLTSLMDVTQYSGMMRVNGSLTSVGDYFLMSGGLQGSGIINAPYFTSMAGVISPGTPTTTGTLTFNGNVILASGNVYMANLGTNGVSDLIDVKATNETAGTAYIDGTVIFNAASGALVRDGNTYTILTAEGGVFGTFNTPGAISAILTPTLTYTPNAVQVEVEAGLYADVIDSSSPIQSAFAQLLDQNRVQYGVYSDLFGPLDVLSQSAVQAALESFAPRTQPLMQSMGTAALDATSRLLRDRMANVGDGSEGGSVAFYGAPGGVLGTMSASAMISASDALASGAPDRVVENALPEDISAYFAGGYIDGKSDGAPTAVPYVGDEFDGYYFSGGLEKAFAGDGFAGIAVTYAHMKGKPGDPTRSVKGNLYQLSFYGANRFAGGLTLDAQLSAGAYDIDAARSIAVGLTTYDLSSNSTPFTLTSELGLSKELSTSSAIAITPRVAVRYANIKFDRVAERGGGPALQYQLDNYESLQGRAGLRIAGKGSIQPYVTGTYVHDFDNKPDQFGANFVGGVGPNAFFALPGDDQDWAEVGAGISTTGPVSIGISAETTIGRSDVSYQTYRASVSVKF